MKLHRAVPSSALWILAASACLVAGTVKAAVVPVRIDCPGGVLRATPDIVNVSAGDIVEWTIDFTCADDPCNPCFYEIVIDPCDPLFTLGYNSGLRSMTQPIASPIAEANGGLCKYSINLYHGPGEPCQTLDPFIHGQPPVPGLSSYGLGLLALLLSGLAVWILRKRMAAEGAEIS